MWKTLAGDLAFGFCSVKHVRHSFFGLFSVVDPWVPKVAFWACFGHSDASGGGARFRRGGSCRRLDAPSFWWCFCAWAGESIFLVFWRQCGVVFSAARSCRRPYRPGLPGRGVGPGRPSWQWFLGPSGPWPIMCDIGFRTRVRVSDRPGRRIGPFRFWPRRILFGGCFLAPVSWRDFRPGFRRALATLDARSRRVAVWVSGFGSRPVRF